MGNFYTKVNTRVNNIQPGYIIDRIHQNLNIEFKPEDMNFKHSAVSYNKYKWTYIHLAVWMNRLDVVEKLIETGADPNIQDQNGDTALNLALLTKNRSISKYLLGSGARTDIKNIEGATASDLMCEDLADLNEFIRDVRIETEVDDAGNRLFIKI